MIMLKLLRKSLKSLGSIYSKNKSSSVKLGAPIITRRKKINKYINDKIYIYKVRGRVFIDNYDVKPKSLQLIILIINVMATGFAIKYCIMNNNALSYGLTVLLVMFYLDKIVITIKTPIKKNDNEE